MHLIESHCELQALLRSDKSCLRFVEAMTNADLRARKLPDRNQWMDRATQSLVVGPQLSQQIRTALRRAVEYCERELLQGTIMNNKLGACNFCVTRAGALEDGMAFTLGNTIFLPSTYLDRNGQQHFTRLCEVLIHEATHVVQRTHAKLTAKLVEDVWKFQPLSDFEFQQLVAANKHPRTNPDTIAQHYRLGDDAWMFCFDSNHPRSLTEGQNVSMNLYTGATHPAKFEHPYEAMAYMMPHAIIDGETSGFCAQEDPLLRAMYLALCAFCRNKQ